jgi:DNA-binding NarL/FixJ family response regulator
MTAISVALAEDAALLREGLVRLLVDRGIEVTAATPDGDALVDAVRDRQPDVVIADIRMPPTFTDEGLRAALTLRREFPSVGLLLFSQYVETNYVSELLAENSAGVGYLLKDRVADTSEFVEAIRRVAGGGTALDPEVVSQLMAGGRRAHQLDEILTRRENDVLALMAEGRSNAAIAATLVVGEGAVEKHVANIFAKLDLPPSGDANRRVLAVLHYLRSA